MSDYFVEELEKMALKYLRVTSDGIDDNELGRTASIIFDFLNYIGTIQAGGTKDEHD